MTDRQLVSSSAIRFFAAERSAFSAVLSPGCSLGRLGPESPVVDRLVAEVAVVRDTRDTLALLEQVQDLASEPGRVARSSHLFLMVSGTRFQKVRHRGTRHTPTVKAASGCAVPSLTRAWAYGCTTQPPRPTVVKSRGVVYNDRVIRRCLVRR